MKYNVLATDYDGTLCCDGHVSDVVVQQLERIRASGRKLLLITGRELPDLLSIFPQITLFDRIVAENGALLYRPDTQEEKKLADPPSDQFFQLLLERGVQPLSRGRVIVSTVQPWEKVVLDTIRDLGLELTVIFNKGAVMVLPSGVNKKTGLDTVLKEWSIPAASVMGIGDGENDHAFLDGCGRSVAVANAIPTLKKRVDVVTIHPDGEGVQEIIQDLLVNDR